MRAERRRASVSTPWRQEQGTRRRPSCDSRTPKPLQRGQSEEGCTLNSGRASRKPARRSSVEIRLQGTRLHRPLDPRDRLRLDLSYALAGELQLLADLLERHRLLLAVAAVLGDPEAPAENRTLLLRQPFEERQRLLDGVAPVLLHVHGR